MQYDAIEQAIREQCACGNLDRATAMSIDAYGPEIFGYLISMMRSEADADEVFSVFSEKLWRGLGNFRWGSSLRTWAYTIAQNAMRTYVRKPHRARPHVPPSQVEELSKLQAQVRSKSAFYLDSEFKARFEELRKKLAAEEQAVLTLRIDRGLAWKDIAQILHEGEEAMNEEALSRESARVKKVFSRTKDKLRVLAENEGLVPSRD